MMWHYPILCTEPNCPEPICNPFALEDVANELGLFLLLRKGYSLGLPKMWTETTVYVCAFCGVIHTILPNMVKHVYKAHPNEVERIRSESAASEVQKVFTPPLNS